MDRDAVADLAGTATDAGSLAIVSPTVGTHEEIFLSIGADGAIVAFNGHVDLGTGIRTALTQIVAEELDVGPERVAMVLGDTERTPDQGPTIASETIQVAAVPLRRAAAQARHHLAEMAAVRLGVAPETLRLEDGLFFTDAASNERIGFGELVAGETVRLRLVPDDRHLKPASAYRLVGRSLPRLDIPAKALGDFTYVHDVRVPGMLHGRVVRPPYAGRDSGDFIGRSLIAVEAESIAHLPGIVAVVSEGDFVGVVAEREEEAEAAMNAIVVRWHPVPPLPDLTDIAEALRAHPSTARTLLDRGDVDAALASAETRLQRTYVWPYHMHASIGPSCSVADYSGDRLVLWSGTQNPHMLRADLSRLLDLPAGQIDIRRHEAAGCYGRNCADDVGCDAALLSRAVGRPVRVQLTREQEHAWEPKGAAQLMEVDGGLGPGGSLAAYDFQSRYPSNRGPNLALLLTGVVPPLPQPSDMGDRTAIPPYHYEAARVTVHDMAPIVRASWMRGVSAMPNCFAHESYIDELATEAGVDPVAFRLRHLGDPRAAELVRATAERAGWVPRTVPQKIRDGGILRGQGFAQATYVHGTFPGTAAAQSAWVADVAVDPATGEVVLERITVGQDSGQMINPDGVRHQIHGNVIQSISRVMQETVNFGATGVTTREWGAYPLIAFPDVPAIDALMLHRPDQPPLGAGESASVPSAAAIANAIFDATGVRFREVPFTPERIKAGLEGVALPRPPASLPPPLPTPAKARPWRMLAPLGAALAASIGTAALAIPWRAEIAPIAPRGASLYSAETLERGRVLAEVGDCAVCHTAEDGAVNAGGRGLETPFGTVMSTNITPDTETGIGAWPYPAFARAMREGISRDGRHLYPAFPYTAFAGMTDIDLEALYAYLMAQAPVRAAVPETRLAFPFSIRPAMAVWNALFHDPAPFKPSPDRSAAWNRGAYLVEGPGHCSACHSPRNAFGAEVQGAMRFAGSTVDGWNAPGLGAHASGPMPWSEDALFAYLRTGRSENHGIAAGPMAPVIDGLAALPDEDIRAMATYLASPPGSLPEAATPAARQSAFEDAGATAARLVAASEAGARPATSAGARLFDGACAACHRPEAKGVLLNAGTALALSTKVHADRPDNFLHTVLGGIAAPRDGSHAGMPGLAGNLSDGQIADLAAYVRGRFALGRPAWPDLVANTRRLRD
ncbi:molybdopterin cofactor-binding domain-containing protein [Aureimonas glaciei]|uniref:molybdopterin cofactor-binding domain-containing protein n=1 Tax=Aureimonas glaciei TaxID=1776957 RepID=UPI00166C2625|nr:molybdopterin cofactor-binding domain-containing protein [Aureimonas glaciei]